MVERVSAAGFIGRAPELAELEAALADAASGKPRLAFLAGESGVGKSRLLREFELRAAELGARAIGGECIELGEDELPYAPLVGAVRPLARAADPALAELPDFARAELARLAPELGDPAGERDQDREGESQRRLFDSLLILLERLGEESPVVFWLEDIHWADRSTRSFLAFLASSMREERVLVVSTYRSDELHRRHPLRPLLGELERGPYALPMELSRFDRDELAAQLADILGRQPDSELVGRLYARSEGNPLFTEELLAGGLEGQGALPPTLREALLTRLDALGAPTRETLGLLSVAGRAEDSLLADAGALDPGAVRVALREALAQHLLRTGEVGDFSFRHALFREVVYDDLLPGERAEHHLALAHALERRAEATREDGTWQRTAIAHHFHLAGEQREALRAAVAAAESSQGVIAFGESAALLDRALSLWPRVTGAEEVVGFDLPELLVRAARVHYLNGDDVRGAALLEQAVSLVDPAAEPRRAARLLGELANTQWSLGKAERSRATLERAIALLPDEPTEEGALMLAYQARFRLLQGRFGELVEEGERAIEMAGALGLDELKAGVMNRVGVALCQLGEAERGESMMREGIEIARRAAAAADASLARRTSASDALATAYVNYAEVLHLGGRSDEALDFLDSVIPDFVTSNRATVWLGLLRAEILFDIGEWEASEAAMPSSRGLSRALSQVNFHVRVAELALGRGEIERARPLLEDSWEILAGSAEPQFIAAVAALRAELALRERGLEAARAIVAEGLDRIQYCTEDGARVARIAALGAAVEAEVAESARDLGDQPGAAEAAERAAMMTELTAVSAEEASGPVERALSASAAAEEARARGEPAGPLWAEAAQRWIEARRPYREACARRRAAEAWLAADNRAEAAAELSRAHEIATRLGSSWLTEEVGSLAARSRLSVSTRSPAPTEREVPEEDRFGLTERERQVLALVASGATNREIAAELFIAEKTASVHVSRILGKLGVKSRTEAAAVAHRQGLAEPVG